MREVSCAKLCLRYVIIYDILSLALLLERRALHNGRRLRQNNTIRSSAAASGVRSTDDIVFPFQIEPTMLGFDLDFYAFTTRKGVKRMPLTITFHVFTYTITITVKQNRHSGK